LKAAFPFVLGGKLMHNMPFAGTVCNYLELTQEQFWVAMARRNYLWPYKPDGSAADVHELPGLLSQTVEGEAST
jgi:hypothetical protein